MSGFIVLAELTENTKNQLIKFVKSLPLKEGTRIRKDEYHITVAFSASTDFDYDNKDVLGGTVIYPTGYEILGKDEKVLTLRVQSPALTERYEELKNEGYKPSFPVFKPHITIALAPSDENIVKFLPLPSFEMKIERELKKEHDNDYTYDPKSMCESTLRPFKEFITL